MNLSMLDVRNLIKKNTYSEVNLIFFNFWNSGLQGDLLEDPDVTRIILFCCRRILLLSLDAPQNITPYSIIEWK